MSLRLLPAFANVDEEDDDGNFTKWMSSYWGHGGGSGGSGGSDALHGPSRERKQRSFRRPAARAHADRRSSLPCVSQLDAMKLNRLHAATMAAAPVYTTPYRDGEKPHRDDKPYRVDEKAEIRPHHHHNHHPRARRASYDDIGRPRAASIADNHNNNISAIQELTESFDKRFNFIVEKTSLCDEVCLICREDIRHPTSLYEMHCTHRFHKPCMEQWLWSKHTCPVCHVVVATPKPLFWNSVEGLPLKLP